MIYPEKPLNEADRQKALVEFDILDTLPEREYDDITRLASSICDTPISLITLIDQEREFRKSALGLPLIDSIRNQTFCGHAILTPLEITIVSDARMDNRFMDNPSVRGTPGIIFYAGMPLVTKEGLALGTLCVIDHQPKELSSTQIEALKSLSNQVVKLLELRKTIKSLSASQKKLEEYAAKMKSFAQLASHDLKEPARMVSSFMKRLENNYASQLDEKAKKYIRFALDGANRMTILIDDLLTFSAIEAIDLDKQEIITENLLKDVVDLLSGVINEKDAIVVWDDLPTIIAPVMSIKLLFQNLIGNGLKYQTKGTRPLISISGFETDTHWQFEVKDNGIGIDEANREKIFEIFKRLHSKEQYPGTGIGLATCKTIVESLGGSIWVKPAPEGGSIFVFTIKKPELKDQI